MHNWFKGYLKGRVQSIGQNVSKFGCINCGVFIPQESVLGPMLFIIYMNDISHAVSGAQIKLFADDINMFVQNRCLN
jgi:hypothetical protein